MKQINSFIRWCRAPHWTRHLVIAAVAVYLIIAWSLTGTFWRGVAAALISAGVLAAARASRWITARLRAERDSGIPFSIVRTIKDLTSERTKFVDADQRWALFTRAQGVKYDGMQPKLHRHQMTPDGDVRAFVNLAGIGGNLDIIRRNIADGTLAGIMNCKEVAIRETKVNRAWLTFYDHPPLNRALALVDLPVPHPGFVSFGIDEEGEPAEVEHGLSVLSIGETGSGKSKAMWNMFASMLRSGIHTEIDLFDPKRTELQVFKPLVGKRVGNILIRSYSQTLAQAEAVMARFVGEMKERADRLDGRQLIDATEDMPARYVWADELNELWQLYAKPDSLMVTLVSGGRSSKDALMGSVQVAKVANLGHLRDNVPLNICMRTKTKENTKAALALDGDVPPCHMIPRDTPGVGYYIKSNGEQRKFRTAHVTDKQLDDMARTGELPAGMLTERKVKYDGPPCFVYLAPDAKTGRVDYVGVAGGLGDERHPVSRRRAQHRRYDRVWCVEHSRVENFWKVHLNDRKMQVKKYPSRSAALIAEERLIKELRPRWNITHNSGNPFSNANLAKRASARRRTTDAAREYREWFRDHRLARKAELAAAHAERVARHQAERDQFVSTVTGGMR